MADKKLRTLLGVEKILEGFKDLKAAFVAGGGRSPVLAHVLDHAQMALEAAGIDVGPPPELSDRLEFDDDDLSFIGMN